MSRVLASIKPADRTEAVDISVDDHAFSFGVPDGLYVGETGNVTGRASGDSTDVVFMGVPAGTILPVALTHVRKTGTTAGSMVGLLSRKQGL